MQGSTPQPGRRHDTHRCIIIGGGVIGSAIACFLAGDPRFDGSISVIEADPGYARASTTLSVGGIRHQFSTPENILASRFATEFICNPGRHVPTRRGRADLGFVENGYLMLATAPGASTLRDNVALQAQLGACIELLDTESLSRRFPWLSTDDLDSGAHGVKGEGWIDPYSLLMLFRESAIEQGARFLKARVTHIQSRADQIESVRLDNGDIIAGEIFVNAAGPAAASICELAQCTPPPVSRRKRQVFVFHCRANIPAAPLVVDPSGVYFRPAGDQFLCGLSPPPELDPDCDDFEVDHNWFQERIWPVLAERVPAFEAIRVSAAWAGHYAYNTFDQNAIVGPHPEMHNLYLANGFSGHGLQQAPAIGRGIAELIVNGRYTSLDLGAFSPERIGSNRPVVENNVV